MKNYGVRFGSGDPRSYTGLSPTFLFFVNMATGATVTPPSITELFANTGIYNFQYGTTTPIAFLVDAATTTPGANGRYVSGQLDPADRADEYAATMIAIGTTITGQGVTSLAFSASLTAFGVTSLAYSTSLTAFGISSLASLTAQGATNLTQLTNTGTTLVAIGNTMIAIGTSMSSGLTVTVQGIGSTASTFGTSGADPVDLFGYMKRIQELLEGANTYNKVNGAYSLYSRGTSTLLRTLTVTNGVTLVSKT